MNVTRYLFATIVFLITYSNFSLANQHGFQHFFNKQYLTSYEKKKLNELCNRVFSFSSTTKCKQLVKGSPLKRNALSNLEVIKNNSGFQDRNLKIFKKVLKDNISPYLTELCLTNFYFDDKLKCLGYMVNKDPEEAKECMKETFTSEKFNCLAY